MVFLAVLHISSAAAASRSSVNNALLVLFSQVTDGRIGPQVEVWRVSSDGKADFLKGFGPASPWIQGYPSYWPVPSPDSRMVAFVRDLNVWIWDVERDKVWKVTRIGRPGDTGYADVLTLVGPWSRDGKKVVYCVTNSNWSSGGMTDLVDPRKVRRAPYGSYVYDIALRRSRLVSGTGWDVVGWDANDEVLLQPSPPSASLFSVDAGGRLRKVWEDPGLGGGIPRIGHISVGGNGSKLIAFVRADGYRLRTTGECGDIVEIDLRKGTVRILTTYSSDESASHWVCRAILSPSGSHVAWMGKPRRRVLGMFGGWYSALVVDGRERLRIPPCDADAVKRIGAHTPGRSVFPVPEIWIDERTVVLICRAELTVVDVTTGRILGRHPIQHGNESSPPAK